MSVTSYRQSEIDKVIESVFRQFNITRESEQALLRVQLLKQMSANSPLLKYREQDKASSSAFRNDVRSYMVDLTAQLLAIRDLESDLQNAESAARDMFNFGNTRVNMIEQKAISSSKSGRVIYETFDEQSFTGLHNSTTVKDGFLRLDNAGRQPTFDITDLKINTLPAKSLKNNINIKSNGDLETIFGTGVGSDSYWTILSSKTEPIIEYIGETGHPEKLRGVISEIEFKTSKPIQPSIISAKFTVASRLYRVFAKVDSDSNWTGLTNAALKLSEDTEEGLYSIIDDITITNAAYTHFKIVIHTPTYAQEQNGIKYYRVGIYNLKLLEEKSGASGVFNSNKYVNNDHVFKSIVTARDKNPGGSVLYKVNFNLDTYSQSIPVLPTVAYGDTTPVEGLVVTPDYSDSVYNYYLLPFPVVSDFIVEGDTSLDELSFGFEINGETVPGSDSVLFYTTAGVTEERLKISYTTKTNPPYVFYTKDLSYNPPAIILHSPENYKELTLNAHNPYFLRCTEVLYNHVLNDTGATILMRYDDENS